MSLEAVDRILAEELFVELKHRTGNSTGIHRDSYGERESAALAVIERRALALGLFVFRDRGANLVVSPFDEPSNRSFIACGSHMDSVPQGGNYDGAAGVIAGLVILANLKRKNRLPRQPIRLFALRGEESARFGKAYLGSSSLFGLLTAEDLSLKDGVSKRTLGQCMRDVGADVESIAAGELLLDPKRVSAWLELHIEQGPILHAKNLPVGIVTGIRGNVRHRTVTCIGDAGHSGAVPRWLRRDAVFATAELITQLDRHWRSLLERGRDLVVTSGILSTDPAEHSIARIPGTVRFSMEFRSQSADTLEVFYDLFLSECKLLGEARSVEFQLDRRLETKAATMDPIWTSRLKRAARQFGLLDEEIPSGAGHDAAVFANVGIPSAMVFVRNENGSHNPNEKMNIDDFMRGVSVMQSAILDAEC